MTSDKQKKTKYNINEFMDQTDEEFGKSHFMPAKFFD